MRPASGALAAALVAYNTATNLLPFPRRLYVPANLAAAAALVGAGRGLGLDRRDVGLVVTRRGLRAGAAVVAATVGAAAGALAVARRSPRVARALVDGRTAAFTGRDVAWHTLVRIPVGTAFFEEVAFRGVLLPVAGNAGQAAAFGLWHVGPTVAGLRENGRRPTVAALAGAVAVTAVGGAVFGAARTATGGLAAPVLAHWAFNAAGVVVTVTVARWTSSSPSRAA